jgi:hypothetical protein
LKSEERIVFPLPAEVRVRFPFPPELMVNAPESAMELAESVCVDPLTINPFNVFVVVAAVIAPELLTEKLEPLITVGPVAAPRVKVPVPFALKERLVFEVEAEIVGLAPENVRAVLVKVSVL